MLADSERVAVDGAGNLYLADISNQRIRKVNSATGIITTVAGGGSGCSGQIDSVGDGCLATNAELDVPYGVAVDSGGNLYIADYFDFRVRKVAAATGIITTVAGNGNQGYTGDGGPATAAELFSPYGVRVDSAGNLYIVDVTVSAIRRVDSNGTITTVAGRGNGCAGETDSWGDGCPATSAYLDQPADVAVDSSGNYYITSQSEERVRKVAAATGIVTAVAGNLTQGFSGDGGQATSAEFDDPYGLAVDGAGNFYIADRTNNRVRKVTISTGIITTVAGGGSGCSAQTDTYGDGCPATSAAIELPLGVAVDSAGNLYLADTGDYRIRKAGPVSSAYPVGFGEVNVGANGTQTVVLSVNSALTLSAVQAGGDFSVQSDSCGPLPAVVTANTLCTLKVKFAPTAPGQRWIPLVATDSNGNNYSFGLEGTGMAAAVAFTPGIITQAAGPGLGCAGETDSAGDGCPVSKANMYPEGAALDGAGNLYIADGLNQRIRKVSVTTGLVTTVAGNGSAGYSGDGGSATAAELDAPGGLAVDSAGNTYISDTENNRIRKVDANGIITTIAGNGTAGYSGDGGPATSAEISSFSNVAVDGAGNLYIADEMNNRIRKVVLSTGIISTVAGSGGTGFISGNYSGDGGPATGARLSLPSGVTVDGAGNLYIADTSNQRIREVNASTGVITTIAGNGTSGFTGDGGPATSAELDGPYAVAVDSGGSLYIVDCYNQRVRRVDGSGNIFTIAGSGPVGFDQGGNTGDGGPATSARIQEPTGGAVDSAGNVYIVDPANFSLLKVSVTGAALSFATTALGKTSSDSPQPVTVENIGNLPLNSTEPGLNFSVPSFLQVAGKGTPVDCASSFSLAAGGDCNVSIDFAPVVNGSISGSLVFTDNALNAGASTQTVSLSGTGTGTSTPPFGNLEQARDDITGGATVSESDSLLIAGWVADLVDGAPVSSVVIQIDGAIYGAPVLGISRPDVAAANGSQYLDSGYEKTFAGSAFSVGQHLVTVVATDKGGRSTTFGPLTFTVTAASPPAAPPFGNLEQAVDSLDGSASVSQADKVLIAGWVGDGIDGAPLGNVKVFIDGVNGTPAGTPELGIPRPDVAATYSSFYLNSGYELSYPASGLSLGVHTATVVATDKGGLSTTFGPLSFTVVAAGPPAEPPFGNLEQAVDSVSGGSIVYPADGLFIAGWAADATDGAPVSNVTVEIDGVQAGTPVLGYARPDVAAVYGASYLDSGYYMFVPVTGLTAGSHSASVVAKDKGGRTTTFGPVAFTVN